MNIITRNDLRELLNRWKEEQITAPDVQAWAEARYQHDDWDCEDGVTNEVLAQLDMLDMHGITTKDISRLLRELESKMADEAAELFKH